MIVPSPGRTLVDEVVPCPFAVTKHRRNCLQTATRPFPARPISSTSCATGCSRCRRCSTCSSCAPATPPKSRVTCRTCASSSGASSTSPRPGSSDALGAAAPTRHRRTPARRAARRRDRERERDRRAARRAACRSSRSPSSGARRAIAGARQRRASRSCSTTPCASRRRARTSSCARRRPHATRRTCRAALRRRSSSFSPPAFELARAVLHIARRRPRRRTRQTHGGTTLTARIGVDAMTRPRVLVVEDDPSSHRSPSATTSRRTAGP